MNSQPQNTPPVVATPTHMVTVLALLAFVGSTACKRNSNDSDAPSETESTTTSTETDDETTAEVDPTGDFVETIGTYLVDYDNARARCDWGSVRR